MNPLILNFSKTLPWYWQVSYHEAALLYKLKQAMPNMSDKLLHAALTEARG